MINKNSDMESYINNQFSDNKEDLKDIKFPSDCDKAYKETVKKHILNKQKNKDSSEDITAYVNKLNLKFPKSSPDTLMNEVEFLQNNLYKASELAVFYTLAKENNFDLGKKILEWVRKLMKLIYNKE